MRLSQPPLEPIHASGSNRTEPYLREPRGRGGAEGESRRGPGGGEEEGVAGQASARGGGGDGGAEGGGRGEALGHGGASVVLVGTGNAAALEAMRSCASREESGRFHHGSSPRLGFDFREGRACSGEEGQGNGGAGREVGLVVVAGVLLFYFIFACLVGGGQCTP